LLEERMNQGQWPIPTLADVLRARRQIAPYLYRTPLFRYGAITAATGTPTWIKHENHQPIGAFKVRGGINLISQLGEEERAAGVIAASTGNHGQSVAYAARLFSVPAIILVPEGANHAKVASMRALGAEVVHHGRDFDDAREEAERLAAERGYRYIHSGNEPLLIAGVGTATLEILEDEPSIETLIVPVGGGSGAAGAIVAGKAIRPDLEIIGVQAEAAPAGYLSWQARELREAEMGTFAEGLATRTAFALPQQILWDGLDDFVLVSEDELRHAMLLLLANTRNLIEGAGAAALAGALKLRDRLAGRNVALMCSGGNVTVEQLKALLSSS
jgi:threonine dehydratase